MRYIFLIAAIFIIVPSAVLYSQVPVSEPEKASAPKQQIFGKNSLKTPLASSSSVPATLSYQGLLTTSLGVPVTDGSYGLQFDFYDSLSGGSSQWTETHAGVSVAHGTFSLILGSTNPLNIDFNRRLYVEVRALNGPSGPSYPLTFSPRSELTSAPSSLAPWSPNGNNIFFNTGSIGIGTTTPGLNGINALKMEIDDSAGLNSDLAMRVAGGAYPIIHLLGTRGTLSSPQPPVNGDILGSIKYRGYDGSVVRSGAAIVGYVDSIPTSGTMPGRISFFTQNREGAAFEKMRLDRNGNLTVDFGGLNNGTASPGLNFGSSFTGEGIASKRTIGGNQYGLDFYTAFANRMTITNAGNVGIGVTAPLSQLHVRGNNPVRILGEVSSLAGSEYVDFMARNSPFSTDIGGMRVQRDSLSGDVNTLLFAAASSFSASEKMRIRGNGNVGIGTSNPHDQLHVSSNTQTVFDIENTSTGGHLWQLYSTGTVNGEGAGHFLLRDGTAGSVRMYVSGSTGDVGIGTSSTSQKLTVAGNICATGTIGTCSDLRYKKDIVSLSSALKNVNSLRGVTYRWKVDEFPDKNFSKENQIGLIAQEVEKIYPEVVQTGTDGYKSIDYARLTPVLIEAIKEQQKQIEELKAMMKSLVDKQKSDGDKSLGELK